MVASEVVYEGRFTRVDRDAALRELHESLQQQSLVTRSSADNCQRRCCPTSGAFMPAMSTPKPTCPTTVRVREFNQGVAPRRIGDAVHPPSHRGRAGQRDPLLRAANSSMLRDILCDDC